MLSISIDSIKQQDDPSKTIASFLFSISMFATSIACLFQKNYVILSKKSILIYQFKSKAIVNYIDIQKMEVIPYQFQSKIILRLKRGKKTFNITNSNDFLLNLDTAINSTKGIGGGIHLHFNDCVTLQPLRLVYSKTLYWLVSFTFFLFIAAISFFLSYSKRITIWIILITIFASFCICILTIRQVELDEHGIFITRILPFINKTFPWEEIIQIRYIDKGEKVPWNQPGHGAKEQTLVLTLLYDKKYYLSVKEHNQLYNEVKKKINQHSP